VRVQVADLDGYRVNLYAFCPIVTSGRTSSFEIRPRGPFSLAGSARFIAGWPPAKDFADADREAVRLCFALDSFQAHAGVIIREAGERLIVDMTGGGSVEEVRRQTERILSLDHDAGDLDQVLRRDEVIGRLHREAQRLRPVLFHSPYEAAAWSVISTRLEHRRAQGIRAELAQEIGAGLDVQGAAMHAFPLPSRLLELDAFPGLSREKVTRLHAVGEAALAGRLDPDRLRELDAKQALAELQEIRGIGPFYAGLILLRAVGVTDELPSTAESRLLRAVGRAYDRPGPVSAHELERIAENWRPYRTWISVLVRAAAA